MRRPHLRVYYKVVTTRHAGDIDIRMPVIARRDIDLPSVSAVRSTVENVYSSNRVIAIPTAPLNDAN